MFHEAACPALASTSSHRARLAFFPANTVETTPNIRSLADAASHPRTTLRRPEGTSNPTGKGSNVVACTPRVQAKNTSSGNRSWRDRYSHKMNAKRPRMVDICPNAGDTAKTVYFPSKPGIALCSRRSHMALDSVAIGFDATTVAPRDTTVPKGAVVGCAATTPSGTVRE